MLSALQIFLPRTQMVDNLKVTQNHERNLMIRRKLNIYAISGLKKEKKIYSKNIEVLFCSKQFILVIKLQGVLYLLIYKTILAFIFNFQNYHFDNTNNYLFSHFL